jgi:flavorubredoxin
MRALVIYESMFGNTQQVANAVGDGLARTLPADVVEVGHAQATVPVNVSLLVVGGPTHAFGMSRQKTRADAAGQTKARSSQAKPACGSGCPRSNRPRTQHWPPALTLTWTGRT